MHVTNRIFFFFNIYIFIFPEHIYILISQRWGSGWYHNFTINHIYVHTLLGFLGVLWGGGVLLLHMVPHHQSREVQLYYSCDILKYFLITKHYSLRDDFYNNFIFFKFFFRIFLGPFCIGMALRWIFILKMLASHGIR